MGSSFQTFSAHGTHIYFPTVRSSDHVL